MYYPKKSKISNEMCKNELPEVIELNIDIDIGHTENFKKVTNTRKRQTVS